MSFIISFKKCSAIQEMTRGDVMIHKFPTAKGTPLVSGRCMEGVEGAVSLRLSHHQHRGLSPCSVNGPNPAIIQPRES
jgi:hypothetical protein